MINKLPVIRNAIVLALVFATGLGFCAAMSCGAELKTTDEVLFFHAAWCLPCKAMEPTVRELADQGVAIREIDVDDERALARQFQIQQVPTVIRVRNGIEDARLVGQISASELCNFAKPPSQRTYIVPPPAPVVRPEGIYYPVARPLWIGNALFGPVWVLEPRPSWHVTPRAQQ
ncbi:MAG: thioredoxin family protein [Planctomycetes bacterium]|nr:thioredoxin family protein [Planctomycetota bacterium]